MSCISLGKIILLGQQSEEITCFFYTCLLFPPPSLLLLLEVKYEGFSHNPLWNDFLIPLLRSKSAYYGIMHGGQFCGAMASPI
jgi:hypothetical protein